MHLTWTDNVLVCVSIGCVYVCVVWACHFGILVELKFVCTRVCHCKTLSAPAETEMHFRKPEMYLQCVLQMAANAPCNFSPFTFAKSFIISNIYELSTSPCQAYVITRKAERLRLNKCAESERYENVREMAGECKRTCGAET